MCQSRGNTNNELRPLLRYARVRVAVRAEVVDETVGAQQVATLVVEPGEDLELEEVTDITGDQHRTGDNRAVKGRVLEHEAVIEGPAGLQDLAAAGARGLDAGQFRLPLGCPQPRERGAGRAGQLLGYPLNSTANWLAATMAA